MLMAFSCMIDEGSLKGICDAPPASKGAHFDPFGELMQHTITLQVKLRRIECQQGGVEDSVTIREAFNDQPWPLLSARCTSYLHGAAGFQAWAVKKFTHIA